MSQKRSYRDVGCIHHVFRRKLNGFSASPHGHRQGNNDKEASHRGQKAQLLKGKHVDGLTAPPHATAWQPSLQQQKVEKTVPGEF